jgi:hypothetical protein
MEPTYTASICQAQGAEANEVLLVLLTLADVEELGFGRPVIGRNPSRSKSAPQVREAWTNLNLRIVMERTSTTLSMERQVQIRKEKRDRAASLDSYAVLCCKIPIVLLDGDMVRPWTRSSPCGIVLRRSRTGSVVAVVP